MRDKEIRQAVSGYSETTGKLFGNYFSPNQMTIITLVLGLISAVLVFFEFYLLAITFFLLSGLADWVDGAIAKATGRVTAFGGVLDSVVDKITEMAIYFAFALSEPRLTVPAMLAATMMMWSSYANQRCKRIGLEKGIGFMQRKERAIILVISLLFLEYVIGGTLIVEFLLYAIAVLTLLTGVHRVYLAYAEKVIE